MAAKRTTTREQWSEIVSDFETALSHRNLTFADACVEMNIEYARAYQCLRGSKKCRPHSQSIINKITKWCEAHRNGKSKPKNKPEGRLTAKPTRGSAAKKSGL